MDSEGERGRQELGTKQVRTFHMTDNNNETKDLQGQEETRGTKRTAPLTEKQLQAQRAIVEFNASRGGRPNLSHGISSLAKTGELPPVEGAQEIACQVDEIIGSMVADLGGEPALTAQRRAIIESQRMCLLVLGLANSFIRREGLLTKRGKPHALLATVVSFANCLRLNSMALGLSRVPRDVT